VTARQINRAVTAAKDLLVEGIKRYWGGSG